MHDHLVLESATQVSTQVATNSSNADGAVNAVNSTPSFGHADASFQAAGGESGVRQMVDAFYDLMGTDQRFETIYTMHPTDKVVTRDKLTRFLCGWLGGPKLFSQTYGSINIPKVHAHLTIGHAERDQWLTCMREAVTTQPYSPEFKIYLLEQLFVPAEAVRKRSQSNANPVAEEDPAEPAAAKPMAQIWVDADACPGVAREILLRAAVRTGIKLTFVANQSLPSHPAPNIQTLQVSSGFDVADDEIVKRLNAGDLVITSDIPLAAEVLAKGGHAISPRGEKHTTDNIGARLNMRDFLDTMRASGVDTRGGPAAYGQRDKQAFANSLDQFLARRRVK